MTRKVLALFFGIILLLSGLELVLQVAHHIARRSPARLGVDDPSAAVILCLGDSHTYGAGVKKQEAYPARLESKLQDRGFRVNVVNLGAPGTNTSEIRRNLPGLLETYQPMAVIVLASVNNGWNRRDAAWSDMEDGLPVPLFTRVSDFLKTRIRIIRGLVIIIHRLDWTRPDEETVRDRSGNLVIHHRQEQWKVEPPEATYDRARRDLKAIIAETRARHAVPVLMTYVTDPEYSFDMPNRLLRGAAASMKAPLADTDKALRPFFMKDEGTMDRPARDELFLPDMHPKAKGYDKISDAVLETLQREGITDLLEKI